jgi:HK97 family phage portal protein
MSDLRALISRAVVPRQKEMGPVPSRGGWLPIIRESFAGAWQRGITVNRDTVLSNHAVFACQTLIASDISKLRIKLVTKGRNGIWSETSNPAFSPVLRKPNRYQNRIQFVEGWVLSKLQRGNAYVLKERDERNVVKRLHVLDPMLVQVLISDHGDVFYQLSNDRVVGIEETLTVPASEIIHDRFNCLFHPLVGISPIFANGLAAMQGIAIQNNSTKFFQNNSQPGGILSAPTTIKQETADRLKAYWEANYTGDNAGKIAVLGDGLKYEAMAVTAHDAQLVDQLKWTAEVICSTYHVPPYKIGVGQMPSYNNIQSLNVEYYSQCLQSLIEAIELCLDEGLGIGDGVMTRGVTYGIEFDVDNLLRMDAATQMDVLDKSKGILSPNEQRARLDRGPVAGGDSPYLQQQNFSLLALSKRDAQADPFNPGGDVMADTKMLGDGIARIVRALENRPSLDALRVEQIGDRRVKMYLAGGREEASFELNFPTIIDRGVFSPDERYERGDAVTHSGSLWIAQRDEPGRPGVSGDGWRLGAKRGRDGKDAR